MKLQPEGTSRRGFLGSVGMAAGLAVVPLAAVPRAQATTPAGGPAVRQRSRTEVSKVEQIFVDVPFKPVPEAPVPGVRP